MWFFDCSKSRRTFSKYGRIYCGVDRLAPFIAPEPEIRESLGEPPVANEELFRALDLWFSYIVDNNGFVNKLELARWLFEVFIIHEPNLELVYCEVVTCHTEIDVSKLFLPFLESRPNIESFNGFDVSWPNCKHSAIFQPGVVPNDPYWEGKLNEFGLLSNIDDALELKEKYLEIYPYPPFLIFKVYKVFL